MSASRLSQQIAAIVRRAAGQPEGPIALHEPKFGGSEWDYLRQCLDTGWVSSAGSFVDSFERSIETYTGVRHAVAVVNGTAALQVCLVLAGVEPGEEVLVPSLTFVASANAVTFCGAIPHFIDSEEKTLGVDPEKLAAYLSEATRSGAGGCLNRRTGRRIRAVVAMHAFGHPVNLEPLLEVCARFGLTLVEDAAESLGSCYRGAQTGTWGQLAALSFNGNKIITTGGGGAILTNDDGLSRRARHITSTAKLPHRWAFHHDEVGFNHRLPNLNAALGVAQMEELPGHLSAKRRLADYYSQAFDRVAGVRFFSEPDQCHRLNVLLLERADLELRDAILDELNAGGIQARPAWELLHTLPMFAGAPRMDLSSAASLASQIINIPSSPGLGMALESGAPGAPAGVKGGV